MWAAFAIQIAIAIALSVIAYLLMPKPKQPKPTAATDMDAPTTDAGRPVPVVFGELTVKGVNILGYWDKQTREYEVKA